MIRCTYLYFKYLLILFIVPTVHFEQSVYTTDENVKLQPVLVLTGLSSLDITIQVSTTDGSAIGKHFNLLIKTLRN